MHSEQLAIQKVARPHQFGLRQMFVAVFVLSLAGTALELAWHFEAGMLIWLAIALAGTGVGVVFRRPFTGALVAIASVIMSFAVLAMLVALGHLPAGMHP